jgi:hypothetical protein
MLVEFSVANFLSFKDRVTLSLVASNDTEHEENTFLTPGRKPLRLLKSVGIYGANASGKSNLLRALGFFRSFILRSPADNGDETGVVPFKLDPKTAQEPSEFEAVFVNGSERYVYGFTVDATRVHEEWLTAARLDAGVAKQRLLFRRHPKDGVKFGASWRGKRRELENAIAGRPKALLLALAAQVAADTATKATATPVVEWFRVNVRAISEYPEIGSEMDFTLNLLEKELATEDEVVEFLRKADVGIDGLTLHRVPVEDAFPLSQVTEPQRRAFLSIMELKPGQEVRELKTRHHRSDGEEVSFDLTTEESAGTQRLTSLFGPWKYLLGGLVIHIDELDRKLHPLITRHLLRLVHNSEKPAQLIFTTHDCTLLDADLLRRDQIWFTEKDEAGATHLYSLWDYKVRKDESYGKGYLKGRYGAIPFVGELSF